MSFGPAHFAVAGLPPAAPWQPRQEVAAGPGWAAPQGCKLPRHFAVAAGLRQVPVYSGLGLCLPSYELPRHSAAAPLPLSAE